MTALILASASPARAALLTGAGVAFEIWPSGLDETVLKSALAAEQTLPRDVADALAEAKAIKISRKTPDLVLGADQTLDLDGRCLDKPPSLAAARYLLLSLRGRAHTLHSAAVLARDGQPLWRVVGAATMHVRSFSDAFLERYLHEEGDALLASVGAYRVEGLGLQLFERIEGDYFTILGLPLLPLIAQLRRLGVCQP